MVGRATVYRWVATARDDGRRVAKPPGGGPQPAIRGAAETALLRMLDQDNHLTLVECRDRLAAEVGVRVHPWTVGRTLRRLDWT
jgi:transposase